MSPDLHPEELFDKAARGELTPGEQTLLSAHLAQCVACRFEHAVAKDFAAMPMPNLDIDRLVSNALLARTSENLRRRPSRRYGPLLAAAVALVAVGSFAAVGQLTGVLPRLISAMTAPATPKVEPVKAGRKSAALTPGAPQRTQDAVDEDEVTAPPVVEAPPPPPPQPSPEAVVTDELFARAARAEEGTRSTRAEARAASRSLAESDRSPRAQSRGLAGADHSPRGESRSLAEADRSPRAESRGLAESGARLPSAAAAGEAPSPKAVELADLAPAPVVTDSAAELFAAANRARLTGDRPFAMAKYQQLLSNWPGSAEAALTQATLGRLLLDSGNPVGALEHLDAYLGARDQTLKEDVLSARAQALNRLGRSIDEGRAWRELLERFPLSVHAGRARERLQALADGP
jgi:TolA-binding protein